MAKDGKYFKLSEFACKCGCGANKTSQTLINICDKIREAVGVPLYVNSGTRCPARNKEAGGVANSNHMTGEAADLSARGAIPNKLLRDAILALYKAGKLPELAGLGYYISKGFCHVDTSPRKATGLRQWTER